ncbi:SMC family ATPase [Arthrobacter flavus]|uniref:Nuclease SbcCD subunit C n=1 Tax=Arthrobacter flavus TaxID=95172 RepID=A0ABW4QAK0_9MICC
MRIHRLELQAFGPFAARQQVDFDRLGAHGLFLLNGPTGAGKSSVLDAICYALYGSVPGARQGAKRLRSDHAPESLAPEVTCEFSVGGRRLEVIRNPQWNRPAKRGKGTTSEPARTLLREQIDGAWVQKSARNDEAGAEIQALLGMDREQFTRVVMLPQGEFAAFLRSDAKPRRELLQRLFSTDRFEQVEQVLAERARALGGRVADAEAGLTHIFRRALDEVERHGLPEGDSDPAANSEPGSDAAPETQEAGPETISGLQLRLAGALEAATQTSARDSLELAALRQARQETSALHGRQGALAKFRAAQAAHLAQREDAAAFQAAVERDRMARILEGGLRALDQATRTLSDATAGAEAATLRIAESEVAGSLVSGLNPDAVITEINAAADDAADNAADVDGAGGSLDATIGVLDAACTSTTADLGALRSALPEEQRLQSLEHRLAEAAAEQERMEAALADCSGAQTAVRAGAAEARAERSELERQVNQESTLGERVAEGKRLLTTIAALETARERVLSEEEKYTAAERHFLELKGLWLDTLRQRLEQAAAELADRLTEDSECPVCGSRSHPRPASAELDTLVTHDQEEAAHRTQDAAEQELDRIRRVRDEAVLDAARLEAQGGDRDVTVVRVDLARDTDLLAAAVAAREALERVTVRLAELTEREENLTATYHELATSLAELGSLMTGLQEQRGEVAERLVTLRDGYDTLAERIAQLSAGHAAVIACRDALHSLIRARDGHTQAFGSLVEELANSSFEDPDEVRAALLPSAELRRAEEFLGGYQRTTHRLEADQDLPELAGALQDEATGLPAVTRDVLDAAAAAEDESAARAAKSELRRRMIEESAAQLERYAADVGRQEQLVLPLRSEYELVKSLADTAAGGGDNSYKMSLGTYVLAARLEQVAEAATERLLAMSDGRYALVHSDALSGNKKSGLGLNVIDGWTGNTRDTATLSGGESFMAALALALGLADVVQAESGGIEIETLFVDEGFGSLDDQSLEQVMDALEGLRDGGRMVGLVSHVAELKQRITAQLQVVKERNGSTLRIIDQLPVDQLPGEDQPAGPRQTDGLQTV